jgi:hypothetical protein
VDVKVHSYHAFTHVCVRSCVARWFYAPEGGEMGQAVQKQVSMECMTYYQPVKAGPDASQQPPQWAFHSPTANTHAFDLRTAVLSHAQRCSSRVSVDSLPGTGRAEPKKEAVLALTTM